MTPNRSALALMISMGLNLILIGLFIGMILSGSGDPAPPHPRLDPGTSAEQQALRNLVEEGRKGSENLRTAHQDARRAVYDVLTAPEFDPAAAEHAFADLRAAELNMRTALQDNLLTRMPDLSLEQRTRLANRLLASRRDRRGQSRPRIRDRRP